MTDQGVEMFAHVIFSCVGALIIHSFVMGWGGYRKVAIKMLKVLSVVIPATVAVVVFAYYYATIVNPPVDFLMGHM